MSTRQLAGIALAALLATSCGGADESTGKATLWVTRDRGAKVLLVRTVPAGLTAMQALEREADVDTRYGGRFVEAIEGIRGDLGARRDWFYFVNGIEGDRSASEYRLRPGDVEWWDYRTWRTRMHEPVVVGAFPEPFLHGYDGEVRPAAVRYASPALAPAARALARVIDAESVAPEARPVPAAANLLRLVEGPRSLVARPRDGGFRAGDPVEFRLSASPRDALRLARDPGLVRRRYQGLP